MAPGDDAWLVHVGTDAGECAHIRPVKIVSRNSASWTFSYEDSPTKHTRCVFDRTNDTRIFPTWIEAKGWMIEKMQARVEAAEYTLIRRRERLKNWYNWSPENV